LADAAIDPNYNQFITFPFNVDNFNDRVSEWWSDNDGPLWY